MLETYEQHSTRKLAATILSVLVIAGAVVFADHFKSEHQEVASNPSQSQVAVPASSTSSPATPAPSNNSSTSNSASTSNFKDGTYSASSSYFVPDGNEHIKVTLTLSNGIITTASIQNSEGDSTSASYQQDFASSYKSHVVGKSISGLQLSVIAGASDTTQGFDNALSQISSKAQA